MENDENQQASPSQSTIASGSPLGEQASKVSLSSDYYEASSAKLVNPVPKNTRIAYIFLPLIFYAISGLVAMLISATNSQSYSSNSIYTVGLSGVLSLAGAGFVLYVFNKQLTAIKTIKNNAIKTFLLPPIVCGALVLAGVIVGCVWAVLDFGDNIRRNVGGFVLGGFLYALVFSISLIYFFGIAQMIYIAQGGLKKGWNIFGKILTILLYIGFGLFSLLVAAIVHSVLDPSTE